MWLRKKRRITSSGPTGFKLHSAHTPNLVPGKHILPLLCRVPTNSGAKHTHTTHCLAPHPASLQHERGATIIEFAFISLLLLSITILLVELMSIYFLRLTFQDILQDSVRWASVTAENKPNRVALIKDYFQSNMENRGLSIIPGSLTVCSDTLSCTLQSAGSGGDSIYLSARVALPHYSPARILLSEMAFTARARNEPF